MIDTMEWDGTDHYVQWCETDDPRLLLVIERCCDISDAPDGDAYAPAYWQDPNRRVESAGHTFDDDDTAEAYFRARRFFRSSDRAARYMRLFHDTGVRVVTSSVHRGAEGVVLFDSPYFRAHVGIPDSYPSADVLAGDVESWQAYLDGEVFGVGHVIDPDRVSYDRPVNLDLREIESWGHYGETYAREEANELCPTLDHPVLRQPLLD